MKVPDLALWMLSTKRVSRNEKVGWFVDTTNCSPGHCCLQEALPQTHAARGQKTEVCTAQQFWCCLRGSNPHAHLQLKTRMVSTKLLLETRLTSGIHRAQLTWTHLVPLRVGFIAPPFLGHSKHFGWTPRAHVRHSQLPSGTLRIP